MDIRQLTENVTNVLATLTVVADVLVVVGLILIFVPVARRCAVSQKVVTFVKSRATEIVGGLALIAMFGSLYFSDVAGYNPCKLCWYQRILMYPIVILAITGLVKKSREVLDYIFPLAALGAPLALYHYLMQRGVVAASDCAVVGYSESCSSTFFMEYGYIAIPMMALSVFALQLVVMAIEKKK
ncbi:disulfide bond formation protein B [Candidatus Falkowbacteria bacterium]|nr:disulfide bond formation protein B [Candidatus Falkowbacteria bacterium]